MHIISGKVSHNWSNHDNNPSDFTKSTSCFVMLKRSCYIAFYYPKKTSICWGWRRFEVSSPNSCSKQGQDSIQIRLLRALSAVCKPPKMRWCNSHPLPLPPAPSTFQLNSSSRHLSFLLCASLQRAQLCTLTDPPIGTGSCCWVPLKPSLLQVENTQVPQPLFTGHVFQDPNRGRRTASQVQSWVPFLLSLCLQDPELLQYRTNGLHISAYMHSLEAF